jgi:endo-alpha-1,4-polygalactosaminidase (GH114 family)
MSKKILLILTFLLFLISVITQGSITPAVAEAGVKANSFAIYYGGPNSTEMEKMKKLDMVIIDAKYYTPAQIKEIQKTGAKVIGYTSGLSLNETSPEYTGLQNQDYLLINGKRVENRIYSSPLWLLDPRSQHLRQVITSTIKSQLYDKGLDGVFVGGDTDQTEFLSSFVTLDATTLQKTKTDLMQATATLFKEIKAVDPSKLVIQDNGWRELKAYTGPYIDGLLWENYNYQLGTTDSWLNARRQETIDLGTKYGFTIFALQNFSSANTQEMDKFFANARSYGFIPYASINGYTTINMYGTPAKTPVDTTPPTVAGTTPANNAVDVPLNSDVSVTFSEAMDQSTLNGITITGPDGVSVPAALNYTANKLVINPNQDFSYGTSYTVNVPTTVKDANGVALTQQYTFSFTSIAPVSPPSPTEQLNLQSYALYYGGPNSTEMAKMKKLDLVIIEPKYFTTAQIKEIQQAGTKVLGYFATLSIDQASPQFTGLLPGDYLVINGQKLANNYDSPPDWLLDPRSSHLRQVITSAIKSQIYDKGLDGVFLDTLNMPSEFLTSFVTLDATTTQNLKQDLFTATAVLAKEIAAINPDKLVIQNNGFRELKAYTAPYVDGIMWENYPYQLGSTDSWVNARRQELIDLKNKYGIFTIALKTFSSANYTEIDKYYANARSFGIIPYAAIGGYGSAINTYSLPLRTN